jgi:rhamnosyltransferase
VADTVTVAIPVRNGGPLLGETLAAVRGQRVEGTLELLVADSGSTDGSAELARSHGARVIEVAPGDFSHGRTRQLLATEAAGTRVAFLTQDAVPADSHWLARLSGGFGLADRVALVFGPYRARAGASAMVRRELADWFGSLSPDGSPRVQRGLPSADNPDAMRELFFTDANAMIDRGVLQRIPFRDIPYAEDQQLARDVLAAGYAKAFVPDAAVVHSHDYSRLDLFRRSFDEWRALRDVHDLRAPAGPVRNALTVQRQVRDDLALLRREGAPAGMRLRALAASAAHHILRAAGAAAGSRARSLPPALREICSLEGRAR